MEKNTNINKYLIITASGGGGILQAAKASSQRIKKDDPTAKIIVKDIMLEWLSGFIGHFGVNTWNRAQKNGKIKVQEFLVFCQRLAEIIFWPQIFFYALSTLIKEDIDFVIDTQPIATSAILKAIRIYNFISKKKIILKKIFVDLPTKKCTHYYNNIKRLSRTDKKLIYISTIKPLIEKNQTEEEFWKKYCKISMDHISYDSYPIRLKFDEFKNKSFPNEDFTIQINAKSNEEISTILKIVSKSFASYKMNNLNLDFVLKKDDFLITILLGSQPSFESTFSYIINFIDFMKNNEIKKNIYIFAYCSSFEEGLITKALNYISKVQNYPNNLCVIPMSFQDEMTIGSLFHRSNLTITRSGGQTAVELIEISKGKICIHSEYKLDPSKKFDENKLLKGIPAWEAGSATYMKEKMNASVVNPDIFVNTCKYLFS